MTTRSAHGELIPLLVESSNKSGQGPLLEGARQEAAIMVDDLTAKARWPQFTARALTVGAGNVLSTPLDADGVRYGS